MNAASAKGNMQYNDPSLRNPNAALDKYDHRMAPEMIVGAIFVAILVSFAIGLWIALDKNLRARLRRWMTCGWRKEDNGTRSAENSLGVQSNMSRISTTSMEEDLESAMRMPLHRPHVSHMPSPLRQNTTETKSLSPLLAQIAPLPALSVS
ncbi:uncharacterized protein PHACADRAFT_247284 [Phanerochaete carnosa HHB-10118-sp]|uniref:Uncharacterized protein n=1 Tax=Phanerochaete carnosa (strain HHB-10118-sp) TaxID=650164 RepID=K5WAN2_PHACS|nr:uncharacterized protein PHACADRAFT_247284 [Phanerochaete carnosa HHB-10118-sp]EKM60998.1 hypothetical protein PHACADRAFT_247284 [Phanerochaete carnosa HHB-10118-sp]